MRYGIVEKCCRLGQFDFHPISDPASNKHGCFWCILSHSDFFKLQKVWLMRM